MGNINVPIDEDLHEALWNAREDLGVPIKYLVAKALEEQYGEYKPDEE